MVFLGRKAAFAASHSSPLSLFERYARWHKRGGGALFPKLIHLGGIEECRFFGGVETYQIKDVSLVGELVGQMRDIDVAKGVKMEELLDTMPTTGAGDSTYVLVDDLPCKYVVFSAFNSFFIFELLDDTIDEDSRDNGQNGSHRYRYRERVFVRKGSDQSDDGDLDQKHHTAKNDGIANVRSAEKKQFLCQRCSGKNVFGLLIHALTVLF
jgi:hypothetical protein